PCGFDIAARFLDSYLVRNQRGLRQGVEALGGTHDATRTCKRFGCTVVFLALEVEEAERRHWLDQGVRAGPALVSFQLDEVEVLLLCGKAPAQGLWPAVPGLR